jgi:hypothetical protein
MTTLHRRLLIAIALFSSVFLGSNAYAQSSSWTVSESQGEVSILKDGITKVAVKGIKLSAGESIKTGANGRAVITRGKQYVVVSRNSHIKVAPQKTKSLLTQFIQYFGNAMFKVDKRKDQHFAVETPYMAAVVKGTTFNVSVSPEGATVQVTEGAVEVATLDGGATQLLLPGDIGLVERNNPFSLDIRGRSSRRIESPNKPAGSPTPTAAPIAPVASATVASLQIKEVRLASADLAGLTDGLITGKTPVLADIPVETNQSQDDNRDIAGPNLVEAVIAVEASPALNVDMDAISGDDSDDIVVTGGEDSVAEMPEELPEPDLDLSPISDDGDGAADDTSAPETDNDGTADEALPGDDTDIAPVTDEIIDGDNEGSDAANDGDDSDDSNPIDNDILIDGGGIENGVPDNDVDGLPGVDNDVDDGNNGNGNDDDGDDDSNPGNGNGNGRNDDDSDDDDDGNNGNGNDDDGDDESNPGNGNGNGRNDDDSDDDDDDGDRGRGRCRTLCRIIIDIFDGPGAGESSFGSGLEESDDRLNGRPANVNRNGRVNLD